jgi:hypothetical protein
MPFFVDGASKNDKTASEGKSLSSWGFRTLHFRGLLSGSEAAATCFVALPAEWG